MTSHIGNPSGAGPDSSGCNHLVTNVKARRPGAFRTTDHVRAMLKLSAGDFRSGKFRMLLYRFIADSIPAVNACLWTWVRLAAAPGRFEVAGDAESASAAKAERRLEQLTDSMFANVSGSPVGLNSFLPELFNGLFRDGLFGGFLTIHSDASGVDRFVPIDSKNVYIETGRHHRKLYLENETARIDLQRPDFYFIPLNGGLHQPLGRSVLQAIPFVAYIEQQLADDMRRASHNAGFHRLHVKLTPPERMTGESDTAYVDRINEYFDATVTMIRSCQVDDNPVTWDNVAIEHIGPDNVRGVANSWFFNHRAMIEEICAGTNLAPFLLGYSYGATNTWSGFKFDIVMRQVRSIQAEIARFLEWVGNIDLALAGLKTTCRFVFDNTFAYQAADQMHVESGRVDNILKLYQAGLLDEKTARQKAEVLL